MNALGAIIGPLTEGMASSAQYQASKHERNVAWRRQQAWELMAPSLRVAGLKAAGLNPILAATQGMSGGPGHVAQGSPGQLPRFNYDPGKLVSSAKQSKMMDDQVATVAAQRDKAESEARAAKYLPERAYHEAGAASEHWSKLQQETLNLLAQRGLTGAREAESQATRARIDVDRLLMEMGVPGARAMEELYMKHPWLRQAREFSGGSLGGAAIGAGAGLTGYFMRGAQRAKDQSGNFGKGFLRRKR